MEHVTSSEPRWLLCNSETGFQSSELSLDQAIQMYESIPKADLEFWFAWQSGWLDWKSVLDLDLFTHKGANSNVPPPLPPQRHNNTQLPKVGIRHPVAVSDRRKYPRYSTRLRIVFRNQQMSFRTFTAVLSVGGISLENSLPAEMFARLPTQVFIAGNDGMKSFRFTITTEPTSDRRYLSLVGLDAKISKMLEGWLKSQFEQAPKRTG